MTKIHSSYETKGESVVRRTSLACTLLFGAITSACSFGTNLWKDNPTTNPTPSHDANKTDAQHAELQSQLSQIASAAKGKVGVAVVMLEEQTADGREQTGQETKELSVSLNHRDHFPMQSVYKLPIGMAVMKQIDAGKLTLEQRVRVTKDDFIGRAAHSPIRDQHPNGVELSVDELMGWMLRESDGTASDVLMKLAGGAEAIQAYLSELGIKDMMILDTEKAFAQDNSLQFRNWTTPEAAVALLRALHERRGLSESSQTFLLKLMIESTPGARRLKGLLPAGTVVAPKTGTSGTDKGVTAATNDIGIVTLPNGQHLAIAVFVADSPADEATREGVIAKVAKAIWEKSSGQ